MLKRSAPEINSLDVEDAPEMSDLKAYPKVVPYGAHKKLDKIFAPADVAEILKAEFNVKRGKMIVSGNAFSALKGNC